MSKAQAFFRTLLEHGNNAALTLDADGRITYCTPATERWLDVSVPLVGTRPFHLIHPEDGPRALQAFNELLLAPRATRELSLRVRAARADWRTVQIIATNALDDPAVDGVMISAHDITDTERLRESLYHAQRMELTGRLAAGIAHDLSNALTIIIGHADLIEAHAGDNRDVDVSAIQIAARGAAALARRLLSLGRRQRSHATDVDVNAVLEGVHRLLKPVIGERISFTCAPSFVPVSVFIDPVRLDQALVNLILNARDAINDRGLIRISAEYLSEHRVEGSAASTWVRIRVTDNGHGMSAGVAGRAFEPHFTTKGCAGSGLGLAMVRETIVEAGGGVQITSTADVPGTTIETLLPATPIVADGLTHLSATNVVGGRETIVVVEDDAAVRQSIARTLHDAGYDVLEVPTVIDGVWLSDELLARAALVIADEVLPDSSGHELVATFRHRKPDIPVLYMSGYAPSEKLARELDERSQFLPKPFDRATVLKHIRRLLDA